MLCSLYSPLYCFACLKHFIILKRKRSEKKENKSKEVEDATLGFTEGSAVKNLPASAGDMGLFPGSGRSPGEGNSKPTPVFSGISHGQRSLVGYSPWGHTSHT